MEETVTGAVEGEPKVAEPIVKAQMVAAKKTIAKKASKKVTGKKVAVKTASKKPAAKEKRVGLLSVALGILRKSSKPLSVKSLMETIEKRHLYSCPMKGKTPARSLSAAIGRACLEKPPRVIKVSKGLFKIKK